MAEENQHPSDVRPVVARSGSSKIAPWLFAIALAIGGYWIFSLMSANRAQFEGALPTLVEPDAGGRISSPAPLVLPGELQGLRPDDPREIRLLDPRPAQVAAPRPALPAPPTEARPVTRAPIFQSFPTPPTGPPPVPEVTYDSAAQSNVAATSAGSSQTGRVLAGRLANPSLTIPQGTVIPAVLETALDSTRPGGVRALVQLDVHGFDGSRILVQKGSRLYGEYEADLQRGQKRALVRWTRLIRPDGVTVALDSPASDPLGRAGVKGKVDGKFLQRFGGALLQSVLDIGVGVATREATDGVVLALPGSTQNIDVQDRERVRPTLKVRHGTSISVFVARDLDFSRVEF